MEETNIIQNSQDDEISLLDLFAVLLRYKFLIIGVTAVAMIIGVVVSVISLKQAPEKSIMPNVYTPKALMLINDSGSSAGGLSSMLASSGMGALAGMAGISTGSSNSGLATYFAGTNSFLDPIVKEFNLIERYKIEKAPLTNSRNALKKNLKVSYDSESGVFSISFTDIDPVFAASLVNFSVKLMEDMFLSLGIDKNALEKKNLEENIQNSYNEMMRLQRKIQGFENAVSYGAQSYVPSIMTETTLVKAELEAQQKVYQQLKTQLELLKIKMASDTPVFQVIENAEVPDQKSGPSRGKLCIILTFAGFFVSIFLAFALNALKNIKNDPAAMSVLRGEKL
ncbi:MAG: lipopolysaccharide biosynthesis protein [Treponema sp.]|nr:lipopolysaccharide biosynthesis protein [Candidatus Treponema equifaecale]